MFSVNFDKISKELCDAKEAEEKYWRENNAKFRAVEQKVATYDEFRDIVLTSHLKPLDKEDKSNGKTRNSWNVLANQSVDPSPYYPENGHCETLQSIKTSPTSSTNFSETWQKLKSETFLRYNFLTNCEPVLLKKAFATEVSPEVLGDMMTLLDNNYREEDAHKILKLLDTIRLLSRFKLSKELLTNTEKSATKSLLFKLEVNLCHEDVVPLKDIYT